MSRLALPLLVSTALALSGCFNPDHGRCTITCASDQSCPSGNNCLSDGFCHASAGDSLCVAPADAGPDAPDIDGPIEDCGNSTLQTDIGEECDDGGRENGDGCNSNCQEEAGFVCAGDPNVCRAKPSAAGQLVVTEIMKNPTGLDADVGEWIEVLNTTAADLDLRDLVIRDDGGEMFTIVESVVVGPGAHLVLGANADMATNGGVPVDFEYSGAQLIFGNGADEVILVSDGVIIDSVVYDNNGDFPDTEGLSLSLSDANYNDVDNDNGLNWCDGQGDFGDGDLGSPGQLNPTC